MLMDYVQVEGFFKLTQDEQGHWLGAYHPHPAMDAGVRASLMLQVVVGLAKTIASAFLMSPAAIASRYRTTP